MTRPPLFLVLVLALGPACGGDDDDDDDDGSDAPAGGADSSVTDASDPASDGGGSDAPLGQPATMDEVVAACINAGSCFFGVNQCFDNLLRFMDADRVHCLVAAGPSCEAVGACLGFTFETGTGCTPGDTCEGGDRVASCMDDGTLFHFDCPSYVLARGPTCIAGAGATQCGEATCSVLSETCNGTFLLECDLGPDVLESVDCAQYGMSCLMADGAAWCTSGADTACAGEPGCDGTDFVSCHQGHEQRRPCGHGFPGRGCYSLSQVYCGYGTLCDPAQSAGEESCTGSTLSLCAAGVPLDVDCTTLGFSGCSDGRCVP